MLIFALEATFYFITVHAQTYTNVMYWQLWRRPDPRFSHDPSNMSVRRKITCRSYDILGLR